jgi:hypothetical protein
LSDFRITAEATHNGYTAQAFYYPHTDQKRVEVQLKRPGIWLDVGSGTWKDDKIQDIAAILPEGLLDALSSELQKKLG